MAEPVTLYKGTETITVVAPSEARRLFSEGWNYEQGQQGEAQGKHGEEAQGREEVEGRPEVLMPDVVIDETDPAVMATPKKRTRK